MMDKIATSQSYGPGSGSTLKNVEGGSPDHDIVGYTATPGINMSPNAGKRFVESCEVVLPTSGEHGQNARVASELCHTRQPKPPRTTAAIDETIAQPTSPIANGTVVRTRRASRPVVRRVAVDGSLEISASTAVNLDADQLRCRTPTPPRHARRRSDTRSSSAESPSGVNGAISPQRRVSESIALCSPSRHTPTRASPLSTTWTGEDFGRTSRRPPDAGSRSVDHSSASSSDDVDASQHDALYQLQEQHAEAVVGSARHCKKYASTHDVSDLSLPFAVTYEDDQAGGAACTDATSTTGAAHTAHLRTRTIRGKTYASTHGSDSEAEFGYSSSDNHSQSSIKPLLSDEPPLEPSIPDHAGVSVGDASSPHAPTGNPQRLQVPHRATAASRRAHSSNATALRGDPANTHAYVPARETLVSQSYYPRTNADHEKTWTSPQTARVGVTSAVDSAAEGVQDAVLDGVNDALSSRPTTAAVPPPKRHHGHRRTHSEDATWAATLQQAADHEATHRNPKLHHGRASSSDPRGTATMLSAGARPRGHQRTVSSTLLVSDDALAHPKTRVPTRRRSSPAPPKRKDASSPTPFALLGVATSGVLGARTPPTRRHSSVQNPSRGSLTPLEPLPPIQTPAVEASARSKVENGKISAEEYAHIARVANQVAEEEVLNQKLETGAITTEEYEHIKLVGTLDADTASASSEVDEDDEHKNTPWPTSTLVSGVSGSKVLDYIADVSVVPMDAMEEYSDALHMCQRLHGTHLPAGELAESMGALRPTLRESCFVVFVMYICDLADNTGFRPLPRDFRVYPTMLLADKLLEGGGVPDGARKAQAALTQLQVVDLSFNPKVVALVQRVRGYYCAADKLHNGMVGVKRIMAVVAKDPGVRASQRRAFQRVVEKIPHAKNLLKEISLVDYLLVCDADAQAVSPLLCSILVSSDADLDAPVR